MAVDMIMKTSLVRKTFDNITLVLISFDGFETIFDTENNSLENSFKSKEYCNTESNDRKTENPESKVLAGHESNFNSFKRDSVNSGNLYNFNSSRHNLKSTKNNPNQLFENFRNKNNNNYSISQTNSKKLTQKKSDSKSKFIAQSRNEKTGGLPINSFQSNTINANNYYNIEIKNTNSNNTIDILPNSKDFV